MAVDTVEWPLGKAVRIDVALLSGEVRAWPRVNQLEQIARQLGAERHARQGDGGAPTPGARQGDHRHHGDQGQDGESAQGGDVPHRLLEPARAERIVRIARRSQHQQQPFVERAGLALPHLAGDGQEGPETGGSREEAADRGDGEPVSGAAQKGQGQAHQLPVKPRDGSIASKVTVMPQPLPKGAAMCPYRRES